MEERLEQIIREQEFINLDISEFRREYKQIIVNLETEWEQLEDERVAIVKALKKK